MLKIKRMFFNDFINYRKRNNREVAFSCRPLPKTFLNTGTTDETFHESGKQNPFRHILKSLASMLKSSGIKLFRITTEIQSGPDAIDK